jgi:hypothetical protein
MTANVLAINMMFTGLNFLPETTRYALYTITAVRKNMVESFPKNLPQATKFGKHTRVQKAMILRLLKETCRKSILAIRTCTKIRLPKKPKVPNKTWHAGRSR